MISLTQSTTPVIGQVAWVLGKIMNGLFLALDSIGIANIGLAIILFTIVVKLLMLPLTVKQQKYTKLTNVMNPEIQAVQKKYKGKKDQESVMKMNEEQKKVYEKYGTSPTGGCLQIFIQMPILFALYQIIQNIPAYVPQLKSLFTNILGTSSNPGIMSSPDFAEKMATITKGDISTPDHVIDIMTKFSSSQWDTVRDLFPTYADKIATNVDKINHMNNFLGVNMSQNPGLVIGVSLLIPILAGLSQWMSVKLQQNPAMANNDDNPAAASMKMMTTVMPLMSAVFAISLPAGLGLYWIAQAVVQIILQLIINRHIDRIGIDSIIQANVDKKNKKREKKGLPQKVISNNANTYTKNVEKYTSKNADKIESLKKIKEENSNKVKDIISTSQKNKTGSPSSLAEKAGMVSKYNDKNKK
ncbi:YidC/Oxa1 family membrane protein insertase [[Clostridium] fimetarium]|uniref:YidC/Oxa1 family membrane protein insertase n=1 Tax=[Clostridium] fimetarium TaxID=99656 RepID=A0A1I0QST9_9FIRM|nr:YidC/Oxa1 family membrane protein insertase [[Clostridium] fimetarium]SEW29991.1 YidC/Oxa1 family membrane protein insertase [[Clostridium] fimetarium]